MADSAISTSAEITDHEEKFEDAQDDTPQQEDDVIATNDETPGAVTPRPDSTGKEEKDKTKEELHSETPKDGAAPAEDKIEASISEQQASVRNSQQSTTSKTSATSTDEVRQPHSRSTSIEPGEMTPKAPAAKSSRFGGFSASLPAVPWGSAAAARRPSSNNRDPSPQPPPQSSTTRRNTPFGWLSRATSGNPVAKSPPLPAKILTGPRRNTAASVSTLGSNSELMLKALGDSQDGKSKEGGATRSSLKEKFKMLRLQEEAGVLLENTEHVENSVPTPVTTDERDQVSSPQPTSPGYASSIASTINPELPPGTASGIAAAPADATPIDWDFWQSVVNEGPEAVARSSPEELTAAIAGGIPQTLRGVIWQVLASSKNDELEAVYNELRVRGTKEEARSSTAPSVASVNVNGSTKERSSIASSQSSVHSDQSTPATSATQGHVSPSPSTEITDPLSAVKSRSDTAALSKLEKAIRRDMGSRTSYSKYAAAAGYQDGLFNVCRAYALFDDGVGYPQGMNFIIMPMLFNMSEEEAFCLLTRLMHKYHLRDMFINEMPGLHLHLYQFERLLEDLEPALYCHLNRRSVSPKLYATQWFLTLFAYRFPLQLVMRVFDLVLCEGLEGAILKFGMALIQRNAEMLLAMEDMQALTTHLKEKLFDVYIDAAPSSKSILESGFFGNSGGTDTDIYRADILVQDACSVKLTPEMLARYSAEWTEKTRSEKARETELENLRTDAATKAAQIRSLEQRAEKSDAEFIEMSNELIKLKVETSDLHDQNESLKGQVEELKKVAESEAKNTEERLRAGTEQVMQRNIEVQNENRHMEEQMAEMERELVEMKLKHAEIHSEHEGLKQRWSDLKKALE